MAKNNYVLYTVSFGDPNNRHYASFWSYQFAMRFFDECVAADRFNVEFESSMPEEEEE